MDELSMQKKGFTLIEMLVVIGIIGLPASLLLPAVSAACSAARTTQDASNLKQLTLAWLRAQQATNEAMMPWMTQDLANEPNYPRYWFGAVDNSQNPPAVVFQDG
jgi:prepilin-type N-terminal cleavage/methylation domain-containing protein